MFSESKRTTGDPQDGTEAIEVGNGATRYDWSIAFTRICMRLPCKDRDIAIAAAMRLAEYPARGTGQCNAKRITIANELGISERHLNRGLKVLKDNGFIRVERHGRDDSVITLLIPPADADIHRFGSRKRDVQQDNTMSHLNGSPTGQKRPPNGTENGVQSDTQCGKTKEQVYQKEQSAAPPRAAQFADAPVSPRTTDALIDTARAFGALLDTYPMDFKDNTEQASENLLEQHLRDGETFAEIIQAAKDYSKQITQNGGTVMMMAAWLKAAPWKKS